MVTKEYAHYLKQVSTVLGLVGLQAISENSAKGIIGVEVGICIGMTWCPKIALSGIRGQWIEIVH